jgi:hypothetical protein
MSHTCCICEKQFEKVPYGEGLNIVVQTDDYEIRWDLHDIIRKSDRMRILKVEDAQQDNKILCVDCYDELVENMLLRIKQGKKLDH